MRGNNEEECGVKISTFNKCLWMSALRQASQSPCSHGVHILMVGDKGKYSTGILYAQLQKMFSPKLFLKGKLPYNFKKSN